jgi:hypothetical protein
MKLLHKKSFAAGFALVGLLALTPASSFGATLVLDTNAYTGGNQGGEFTASGSGLDLSSYSSGALTTSTHGQAGFSTFCMEYKEEFNPGSTYSYTLNSNAFGGDVAGGGGDPVSKGTAWLYSQFAQGILDGYSYTGTSARKSSNTDLQLAFWYLEDEISFLNPSYNPASNGFLTAVSSQFGSLAAAKADANGAYGVQILNLTSSRGATNNQSQLYYHNVPDTGATLALLGLAFMGLIGLKRKFADAQ